MTFNWTEANTTIANINAYMGRTVDYLSRDDVTNVDGISASLNRSGDEGTALIHIPIASVATPLFADKITDHNSVEWRISEVQQANDVYTPCELKQVSWWKTVDIEESIGGTWSTHTSDIYCMIEATGSSEDFEEYNELSTDFVVRMQNLTDPTQKMRIKWGTRYLYISGIRPDESFGKWMEVDCREGEA